MKAQIDCLSFAFMMEKELLVLSPHGLLLVRSSVQPEWA